MIHMRRTSRLVATKLAPALALGFVLAIAAPTAASGGSAAGTLHMHVGLTATWQHVACPAGTTGPDPYCFAIQGKGVVPGLGRTAESYAYVIDDAASNSTTIHVTATITVTGKGTINVSAATPSPVCPCTAGLATFDFTVTGGTGAYTGAGGSGTAGLDSRNAKWSGILTVPGYTFDIARPVIHGAVHKAVKAPSGANRVRVKYKITARDPDEGSMPVTCLPRSGSRFKLGSTTVRCTTTDANGNTAKAKFKVTVNRR